MSFPGKFLAAAVIVLAALAIGFWHWAHAPLRLTPTQLDVTIEPRSSLRSVARQLERGGVPVNRYLFEGMTRVLSLSSALKAGNYEFSDGISPYQVLNKIARGDVDQYVAQVIEGWTFARMRAELDQNPAIRHDTAGMTDAQILKAIGAPETQAEGLFFPDTYLFAANTSDINIYSRAYRLARLKLAQAWNGRADGLPLERPYDALILASIIERETGRADDRAMVSAVFVNRLRVKMPLQTDPSVIYGIGLSFDGRLTRQDLRTDTPYNTYLRTGLPPTPISMPGFAALYAALHPAATPALYFVARGDGSSIFSDNLSDHNLAVDKYQRGR
ncbi:MAG: endolytic transglycosylase MltG [Janthinobacterium lividum]